MTQSNIEFNEEQYDDEAAALEALKLHATAMQIKFHPSIGYDALYAKVEAAKQSEGIDEDTTSEDLVLAADVGLVPETPKEVEARVRKEMRVLTRVEVQCLDPMKKDWSGEILTFANDVLTIRRMIPFNTPWHMEKALINMLEEKTYQYYIEKKLPNGLKGKEPRTGKAFSIKYLDPLSEKELGLLAIKQARQGE